MNVYYFAPHLVTLSIKQLTTMASFKHMVVGDIAVLRIDYRIVMIFINQPLQTILHLSDYPMVSQVICDNENLPKFLPIIYYNDGYREKIIDVEGILFLNKLFAKDALAADVIYETLQLAQGRIDQRKVSLTLKLMQCKAQVPTIDHETVKKSDREISKEGQLLIVEHYFTEKMKKEFYDNLAIGLSERDSLVLTRRKFPKLFNKILNEFKNKDIYTRI